MYYRIIIVINLLCIFCLYGCNTSINNAVPLDQFPDIFPDYVNVTIPYHIAPLNFRLLHNGEKIKVRFLHNDHVLFETNGRRGVKIPVNAWHKMLQQSAGDTLQVQVYSLQTGKWYAYQPFHLYVSTDSMDPYIVYRLIDPGYELWGRMGIFQRNVSNFDESVIITNKITGNNCINCHSFHDYCPDRMMFHSRGEQFAGTFLLVDGHSQRVNTQTEHAVSAGSYPIWHPSGDYIAFSSNVTNQSFHTLAGKRIEVYDNESDLVVWDIKKNVMLRDTRFTTKDCWETFPAWSPDGHWLYYCFADGSEKNVPSESKQLIYGLSRVDFNASTGRFGQQIDTIVNPATSDKSISFPRLSPDGRYLLYTTSASATFPIWHKEANLEMIDLLNHSTIDMKEINSDEADSYHAWSSNGRWILFSSRRINGLYTHLFFAYFDLSGQIHKPFLLPQKNPEYYTRLLKSYNIPEFVNGKVDMNPYEISKTLKGETVQLTEIMQDK